jgi:hypothetical protein
MQPHTVIFKQLVQEERFTSGAELATQCISLTGCTCIYVALALQLLLHSCFEHIPPKHLPVSQALGPTT